MHKLKKTFILFCLFIKWLTSAEKHGKKWSRGNSL